MKANGRVAALLELGSGFNPEFTGRENVFLNASMLGLKKEEIDARIDDILEFADIGDFVDQPVKAYSSGMAVRLAFAVIAHVNADILIVDEALSVGDVFFNQKCMRFINRFREKDSTVRKPRRIPLHHYAIEHFSLSRKANILVHQTTSMNTTSDLYQQQYY